jgi:peptide/nickel transport system substrate-binding protein
MDDARAVMEEAGYSDSDPYQLTYTSYTDRKPDAYNRIGQILQSQLSNVHIELELEQAPFSAIIDGALNNRLEFFSLGNGLAYPSPADTLRLAHPTESNFTRWGDVDGKGPQTEAATRASEAWATVQDNLGPSESARQARNEAYLAIEECNWEDVPALLDYHPIDQQYWYDTVDTTVKTSSFHEFQYDTLSME